MAGAPEGAHPLSVVPIWKIPAAETSGPQWLVEGLWGEESVGVLGGAPKCAKTWLSLEMALAVASGAPCLGVFPVSRSGPVLVLSAEDAPRQVRERMEGLSAARGVRFETLDVSLILSTRLRLEETGDCRRFEEILDRHRPRLLVLDPFIRLHGVDENSASEISAVLAKLREWQRLFRVAILVVHHTRKVNGGETGGQSLRGSSDFHAWGDSNLYLKRRDEELMLTIEHRSAAAPEPILLRLETNAGPPRLETVEKREGENAKKRGPSIEERVVGYLARTDEPRQQDEIRAALELRNQRLIDTLRNLQRQGRVVRSKGCWSLARIESGA